MNNSMIIDRLETHDRYQQFTKQSFDIGECCQDLIDQRPFGEHGFYIFAHARTDDDGLTKRILWQPRLTKPKAQTNSMLFKVKPGSDNVEVVWMIPAREMWPQYEQGLICENQVVKQSIHDFENNRVELERRDPEDLSDAQIDAVYREIRQQARTKQANAVSSLGSLEP